MNGNSFDILAANGIINYDAESYIKNGGQRYVGTPESEAQYAPMDKPLMVLGTSYGVTPGINLHGGPSQDSFISHGNQKEKSGPTWKQALTAVLIGGTAAYTAYKVKRIAKISSWFNKVPKAPAVNSSGTVAKLWTGIKTKAGSALNWVKGLPKPAKIGGGIVAGLLGLYEISKAFSRKSNTPE